MLALGTLKTTVMTAIEPTVVTMNSLLSACDARQFGAGVVPLDLSRQSQEGMLLFTRLGVSYSPGIWPALGA